MGQRREIKITSAIRAKLLAQKERTKVGTQKLLNEKKSLPKGLSPAIVNRWLTGAIKSATKEHLDYVMSKWESLPSIAFDFIEITSEDFEKIHTYKKLTNMGATTFLKKVKNIPADLTAEKINNWLSGNSKTVREDHLSFVLEKWKELAEGNQTRIAITPEVLTRLIDYRDRGNLLPGHILKNASDKPKGLSAHIISTWLSGRVKRVRKDHLDYVLLRCKQFES